MQQALSASLFNSTFLLFCIDPSNLLSNPYFVT